MHKLGATRLSVQRGVHLVRGQCLPAALCGERVLIPLPGPLLY